MMTPRIQKGNEAVEASYLAYARLFDRMRGARWLLSSNPVWVELVQQTLATGPRAVTNASVNAFTLSPPPKASIEHPSQSRGLPPALLLIPVMLANVTEGSVTLVLNLQPTETELGWLV